MAATTSASSFSSPSLYRRFQARVPLRSQAKQVILNVYSKLRSKHPRESINSISEMCADLTGVNVATVKSYKTEAKSYGGKPISPLRTQKTSVRRRLCREDKFDDFTLSAIKRKVHQCFFATNDHVSVQKVQAVLKEDETMPQLCRETLRIVLKMAGFVYGRRQRNSLLIGRNDIVQWRSRYIRDIKKYRKDGRSIVYIDETWVNSGHHKSLAWQDATVLDHGSAFKAGLTTGPKTPSGKGSRLILTHAGNEDGFIDAAEDIFEGKKTGDYHEEMDGVRFKNWFVSKLLPNIKANSVIVMDNASYHSVKVEAVPTMSKKKCAIQDWLTSKNVPWKQEMTKKQLMGLVDLERPKYNSYVIDKIAEKHGHSVLRLPPYHCELNPIELAWAKVKDYVAVNNKCFTMAEIRKLLPEGISQVTPGDWKKFIAHVIKEEDKMFSIAGIIEKEIQSFVINIGDDSDEESSSGEISDVEEME